MTQPIITVSSETALRNMDIVPNRVVLIKSYKGKTRMGLTKIKPSVITSSMIPLKGNTVLYLEDSDGSYGDAVATPSEPDTASTQKYYILPIFGGENSAGWGNDPYDMSQVNPRIMQLGRFATGSVTNEFTVKKEDFGYGDDYSKYRPYEDCNLKLIPATPCLDHIENLFKHQVGGTVGFGLSLANILLPYIPEDYGILIVPCGKGLSTPHSSTSGNFNTERLSAVDDSTTKYWNFESGGLYPLVRDLSYRVEYSLNLNPENKLLPAIFSVGSALEGIAPHYIIPRSGGSPLNSFAYHLKVNGLADRWVSKVPTYLTLSGTRRMHMYTTDLRVTNIKKLPIGYAPVLYSGVYEALSTLPNYHKRDGNLDIKCAYQRVDIDEQGDFVQVNSTPLSINSISDDGCFSTYAHTHVLPRLICNGLRKLIDIFPDSYPIYPLYMPRAAYPVMFDGSGVVRGTPDFNINDGLILYQNFGNMKDISEVTNAVVAKGVNVTTHVQSGKTADWRINTSGAGGFSNFYRAPLSTGYLDLGNGYAGLEYSITPDTSKPFEGYTRSMLIFTHVMTTSKYLLLGSPDTPKAGSILLGSYRSVIAIPDTTDSTTCEKAIQSGTYQVGEEYNNSYYIWQHSVIRYTASTQMFDLFINGKFAGSLRHITAPDLTNPYKIRVCGDTNGDELSNPISASPFNSYLVSTRIYDKPLSDAQINGIYIADFDSKKPAYTSDTLEELPEEPVSTLEIEPVEIPNTDEVYLVEDVVSTQTLGESIHPMALNIQLQD